MVSWSITEWQDVMTSTLRRLICHHRLCCVLSPTVTMRYWQRMSTLADIVVSPMIIRLLSRRLIQRCVHPSLRTVVSWRVNVKMCIMTDVFSLFSMNIIMRFYHSFRFSFLWADISLRRIRARGWRYSRQGGQLKGVGWLIIKCL